MTITVVLPSIYFYLLFNMKIESIDDTFFVYYISEIYDFDVNIEKINTEITPSSTVFIIINNIKNELEKYFKKEDNEIIHSNINIRETCSKIIENHLKSNLIGYDLLFSLFTMSIRSYRHMRICDPYPKLLKDFPQPIIDEIINIPSFDSINYYLLSDNQLMTLLWLVNDMNTKLELCNNNKNEKNDYAYCFKVDKFYNSINFEKMKKNKGYYVSYHGSNIENYHNIIHNGLLNMSGSKNERNGSIMGEGIYSSSDQKTCLHFCNNCPYYWKNSIFIKDKSKFDFPFMIICECEVIKDEKVKLRSENGECVTIDDNPYIICEDKNLLNVTKLYLYSIYSDYNINNNTKVKKVMKSSNKQKEVKRKDKKDNFVIEIVILVILLAIIIKYY